jgi:hypothetical protein
MAALPPAASIADSAISSAEPGDKAEGLKAGDDGVGIGHVVVEHGDVRALIKPRPVRKGKGDILVIVEDGDPGGLGSIRHGLRRRP